MTVEDMDWWIILLIVVGAMLFAVLLVALLCYFKVFYSRKRKPLGEDAYEIPEGEEYEAYRDQIIEWVKLARTYPHEDVEITSHDGLTLRGRYYECNKDGIVEILFHGYRGNAERDMSGGVARCFALGRNALIVDHRGSGRSDGHTITFGILEKRDALRWVDFAIEHFGKDVRIILTGISMGAATVMMASGENLPENVICTLADCGYSSAKEIIKKVIREMKLPAELCYPFVKLGAFLFGGFRLEEDSPMEAMARVKIPLIFIHGASDDFVPCDMSERLFAACASPHKSFVKIEGAAHGLAYPTDKEGYVQALADFQAECGF